MSKQNDTFSLDMKNHQAYHRLPPKKRMLLKAYLENGFNISKATQDAGLCRRMWYRWLSSDEDFKKALDEIMATIGDTLECEAVDRAINGSPKAIIVKGQVVGHSMEHDNSLLWNLLKSTKSKYRDSEPSATVIQFDAAPTKLEVDAARQAIVAK